MPSLRICIDVSNLDQGIAFYTRGLQLKLERRLSASWAELGGAPSPIDLLANPSGTKPVRDGALARDYGRHWTPVHLDFVVEQIDAAIERCTSAGARIEQAVVDKAWGKLAILSDPFGNGFCLLEFRGKGYDELLPAE